MCSPKLYSLYSVACRHPSCDLSGCILLSTCAADQKPDLGAAPKSGPVRLRRATLPLNAESDQESDSDGEANQHSCTHAHNSESNSLGQPMLSGGQHKAPKPWHVHSMQLRKTDTVDRFLVRLSQPYCSQSPLQSETCSPSPPHHHQQWSHVPAVHGTQLSSGDSNSEWDSWLARQASSQFQPAAQQWPQPGVAAGTTGVGCHDVQPEVATADAKPGLLQPAVIGDTATASPVQVAVAAVAGRLQSVQQGLATAEERLAQLTGGKAASRLGHARPWPNPLPLFSPPQSCTMCCPLDPALCCTELLNIQRMM